MPSAGELPHAPQRVREGNLLERPLRNDLRPGRCAHAGADALRLPRDAMQRERRVDDEVDDTDVPANDNLCRVALCTNGAPSISPVAADTSCGPNLVCDGNGTCVGCVFAQALPRPRRRVPDPGLRRGDLRSLLRFRAYLSGSPNGGGLQDGGLRWRWRHRFHSQRRRRARGWERLHERSLRCRRSLEPRPSSGTSCENGAGACDAFGTCVECLVAVTCPGVDDECKTRTCLGGTCGFSFTPAGTPTSLQTPQDCHVLQCNGAGAVVAAINNGDLPFDGLQCTNDVCNAGVPSNPPFAAGSPCNELGGSYCNGTGQCVECVTNAQCSTDGAPGTTA